MSFCQSCHSIVCLRRNSILKKIKKLFFVTVALAAAFPDLELFISLCGAIFLSSLGLLTPAIVDTVHNWDRGLGFCNWILWKNIFIGLVSLVALFAGSYVSISNMVEKFGEEKLLEMASNATVVLVNGTTV